MRKTKKLFSVMFASLLVAGLLFTTFSVIPRIPPVEVRAETTTDSTLV